MSFYWTDNDGTEVVATCLNSLPRGETTTMLYTSFIKAYNWALPLNTNYGPKVLEDLSMFPGAKDFIDFQPMIDEMSKGIPAVIFKEGDGCDDLTAMHAHWQVLVPRFFGENVNVHSARILGELIDDYGVRPYIAMLLAAMFCRYGIRTVGVSGYGDQSMWNSSTSWQSLSRAAIRVLGCSGEQGYKDVSDPISDSVCYWSYAEGSLSGQYLPRSLSSRYEDITRAVAGSDVLSTSGTKILDKRMASLVCEMGDILQELTVKTCGDFEPLYSNLKASNYEH